MKQKKIIAAIVFIVSIALLIAICWFLQSPHAGKKISDWMVDGEYLGNKGVVLQATSNECGPCALKMIFEYYNISLSLKDIEKGTDLTQNGSSMFTLKKFAELKGLKVDGWQYTLEDFMHSSFPSILYVNNNHFIVADSMRQDTVYIRNPAIGRMKIEKNKLCKIWEGETLVFKKSL